MQKIILSFIFVFGFLTMPVSAQINTNSLAPALELSLEPAVPQPEQSFTVFLNDYSQNSFGSTVTWFVDNKKLADSQNLRKINLQASEDGVPQQIKAVIISNSGVRKIFQRTIIPAYLDIIIEPQTHTPEFYRGRSLPSIGSDVNATALISNGVNGFKNKDLVYTWKVNNKVVDGSSVRGRNQTTFKTPMGREMILSVYVAQPDGTVIGNRSIILPSVEPTILFYEVSALFGTREVAINNSLNLVGNSTTIVAETYNLDSRVFNDPDISTWQVDNSPSNPAGSNPYEVSIQHGGQIGGSSNLSFSVRDTTQFLQGADGNIRIKF